MGAVRSSLLVLARDVAKETCLEDGPSDFDRRANKDLKRENIEARGESDDAEEDSDDEDEENAPSGYHLMVDIDMKASGVSVVGWEYFGPYTVLSGCASPMDLFSSGLNPVSSLVPVIESAFGVPAEEESLKEKPKVGWSYKVRRYREEPIPLQYWDMGLNLLHPMDVFGYKKEIIYSGEIDFQRIDVYDVLPGQCFKSVEDYEKSLANDASHYSIHADLFSPDRAIYMDGVIQSRSKGEHTYHKSLVQPAMCAHPNPERVAIVGGGETVTLHEVLTHKSVRGIGFPPASSTMKRL